MFAPSRIAPSLRRIAGLPWRRWRRASLLGIAGLLAAVCEKALPAMAQDAFTSPVTPERWSRPDPALAPDPALEARIGQILAAMSLEQKVGQVIQADSASVTPEDVRRYRLGSVLSGGNSGPGGKPYSTATAWLRDADAYFDASVDPAGVAVAVPVIWGIDAVHGHNNVIGGTLFPHNVGLGAANDPDLMRAIGGVVARELRVTGHDWTFAPTLAVPQDLRWGRAYEGFSEDPALVARYAPALIEGLQGAPGADDFLTGHHVIATAKHFIGDGGTQGGQDQGDTILTETSLRDIHGAGYGPAIGAGVQAIMASFSSWNGRKVHGDKGLLTDVLRGGLGFDGLLVGDWNAHGQISGCTNEDCPATFQAGLDMAMAPDSWRGLYASTLAQVRAGTIPMARLDEAVRRILRVKLRAGLFDAPRPSARPLAGDDAVLGAPAHRALARRAVRASLVLLKNEGGLVPLTPGQRILVTGDGAHSIAKQSGGWTLTWQGGVPERAAFPGATTIFEGIAAIAAQVGSTAVLHEGGPLPRGFDVAIAVYGEDPYAEFRGDIESLSHSARRPQDVALLRQLKAAGLPVVSVFLSGRPLWTNPELNASDAFLAAWLPGSEGAGIAEMLLASADGTARHGFTGRLPMAWPARPDAFTVADRRGTGALFPLGHGLDIGEAGSLAVLPEDLDAASKGAGRFLILEDGKPGVDRRIVALNAQGEALALGETQAVRAQPVNTDRQEGALAIAFLSAGAAVAIAAPTPEDLRREANADFEIELVWRAETDAPPLRLAMGAAPLHWLPVGAPVPAPGDAWARTRVSLSCFADAGADLGRVSLLLAVKSAEPARLTLRDIRLVQDADGEETCP